eukprot:PhM_4_TR14270/c2_g2_i2/m.4947
MPKPRPAATTILRLFLAHDRNERLEIRQALERERQRESERHQQELAHHHATSRRKELLAVVDALTASPDQVRDLADLLSDIEPPYVAPAHQAYPSTCPATSPPLQAHTERTTPAAHDKPRTRPPLSLDDLAAGFSHECTSAFASALRNVLPPEATPRPRRHRSRARWRKHRRRTPAPQAEATGGRTTAQTGQNYGSEHRGHPPAPQAEAHARTPATAQDAQWRGKQLNVN